MASTSSANVWEETAVVREETAVVRETVPEPVEGPSARSTPALTGRRLVFAVLIGLAAGFFSGLFGIGGGVVVVPALIVLLGLSHHRAVGTSLLAILPAAAASTVAYAVDGNVDWAVGGILAVGAVAGAQLGAALLVRIRRRAAQWLFVGFVGVMIVQLLLVVPDRGAELVLDASRVVALIVLGVAAGALSSLLGIGGGGVVVPVLMVWFGLGDLAAKGASLVMVLPGVASGLITNLRRHNVDLRAGTLIGVAAIVSSPAGAWVAHIIPAQAGAWLFAAFLAFVGVTMVREALRS